MSLRHAILVLLKDQEASGYDLAREFANTIGLVWNATHQQIYLELSKLSESGMVQYQHIPQDGKPDKKLYRITELGKEELVRWLHKPVQLARTRDAFMVKIAGGDLTDIEPLLGELHQLAVQRRERLAIFERLQRQAQLDNNADSVFNYLVLRRGILDQQAWLKWADEVSEILQRNAESVAV